MGEERAKIVCNHEELKNIDVVYASNCVRTLQTAKYLLDSQGLKVIIDDRLDERRDGKNTVTYSNRYFTVFDCYYGGVHYVLERKSSVPEIKGKKPKINDKKIMLFDKNEPERSLLEEDIEAVKGISSGIFLIILGIFWAGMLFLSMITNK